MLVYAARNGETAVECDVEDLDCGAGRIICPECGGDGNWGKFAPGMADPDMPCPDCKGTGRLLVSI